MQEPQLLVQVVQAAAVQQAIQQLVEKAAHLMQRVLRPPAEVEVAVEVALIATPPVLVMVVLAVA